MLSALEGVNKDLRAISCALRSNVHSGSESNKYSLSQSHHGCSKRSSVADVDMIRFVCISASYVASSAAWPPAWQRKQYRNTSTCDSTTWAAA